MDIGNWERVTILLLNSQPDTITLLTDWFGALGSRVHHTRTLELCQRVDEARTLIDTIEPSVILFDLAVPYTQNWQCFRGLSESGIFGDRPVILTTANRRAVDQIIGPTDAFEILGTPHDLWHLQELIEWRIAGKRTSATGTRH
jgi:CheY-like chemotaxis protein